MSSLWEIVRAFMEMAAADKALARQDRADTLAGISEPTPAYRAATDRVVTADAAMPRLLRAVADRVIFWWHRPLWMNVHVLAAELEQRGYGRDETS